VAEALLKKDGHALRATKWAVRRMIDMTYENAEDYLIRAQEALHSYGGVAARKPRASSSMKELQAWPRHVRHVEDQGLTAFSIGDASKTPVPSRRRVLHIWHRKRGCARNHSVSVSAAQRSAPMTPPMKLTLPLVSLAALVATPALAPRPAMPSRSPDAGLVQADHRHALGPGPGNETPKVAALYRDTLVKAGWSPSDIEIVPVDDTAYLLATWKGGDPSLKPLVLSGHMDVVEAKRADWQRDPFVPVVENGYLFGRGALDMKFNAALAVSTLIEMRHKGFKPKRTIIIAFSGDEETTMKTSRLLAERLKGAGLVINVDGGGGMLAEDTAKPLAWTWDGAEKNYADFQLEVTNPGGHSSAPRKDNAIVQLSQALVAIGAYHFTPNKAR
jgi:hypothetical protein